MRIQDLDQLRERQLVSEEQFTKLQPIISGERVSVFYDLRILLYLGVMLFTTGIGILIYKNIGDVGHLLAIGGLFITCGVCYYFAFTKAERWSPERTTSKLPWYDYVVLLASLLFISVLGYLQFRYDLFDEGLGETTLVTAALFFYSAYRFDHLGVLSLAITAFASFWGITVTPREWYDGNIESFDGLQLTAVLFGAGMTAIALVLETKNIKRHFTFTYLNFSSLILLTGALSAILSEENQAIYVMILLCASGFLGWYAWKSKSFLLFFYAITATYIAATYILLSNTDFEAFFWSMYFLLSSGGLVYLVIRNKSIFKRS